MSNKKPDSFRDLKKQFQGQVPSREMKLVNDRYNLEIRNSIAQEWRVKLEEMITSRQVFATDSLVLGAFEALAKFDSALSDFRQLTRPTLKRANQVDELFWELKGKMGMIPDLELGLRIKPDVSNTNHLTE
jgi:hypothetical protein